MIKLVMTVMIIFCFCSELETSDNDGRREVTNLMDMPLTMVGVYKHHYHHFECYHRYNKHPANHENYQNHHFICENANNILGGGAFQH